LTAGVNLAAVHALAESILDTKANENVFRPAAIFATNQYDITEARHRIFANPTGACRMVPRSNPD
jgi:hypothetical protein